MIRNVHNGLDIITVHDQLTKLPLSTQALLYYFALMEGVTSQVIRRCFVELLINFLIYQQFVNYAVLPVWLSPNTL